VLELPVKYNEPLVAEDILTFWSVQGTLTYANPSESLCTPYILLESLNVTALLDTEDTLTPPIVELEADNKLNVVSLRANPTPAEYVVSVALIVNLPDSVANETFYPEAIFNDFEALLL
jgi:hypothetical protein